MAGAAGACVARLFPSAANAATTVVKTKSNLAERSGQHSTSKQTRGEERALRNSPFEGGKHISRRGRMAGTRVPAARPAPAPAISQTGSQGDEAGEPEDHGHGLDGEDGEAVGGDGEESGGEE